VLHRDHVRQRRRAVHFSRHNNCNRVQHYWM